MNGFIDDLFKPTVLVVDDEAATREILSDVLEDDGYKVILAKDGRDGLMKANMGVGIILLDVLMPEIDGLTVCRQLQSKPETAHIPIVFLTAYSDQGIKDESIKSGGFDCLQKPVSIGELRVRLEILSRLHANMDTRPQREAYRHFLEHRKRLMRHSVSG